MTLSSAQVESHARNGFVSPIAAPFGAGEFSLHHTAGSPPGESGVRAWVGALPPSPDPLPRWARGNRSATRYLPRP
jgi:hypothetical protein